MIQTTKSFLQARPDTIALLRKNLILPAEHGAWSWLLVPFLATCIACSSIPFSALLILVAGLSLFFMRQPASILVRIYSGKSNSSLFVPAALWILLLGSVTLVAFAGLLALDRHLLMILVLPVAVLSFFYLQAVKQGRSGIRASSTELMGSAGLALMAPATWIAIHGEWAREATILFVLLALQNSLSVLYVRFRLAKRHREEQNRLLMVTTHVAALMLVAVQGNWTLFVLFAFLAVRAVLVAWKNPLLTNVKRFGFLELGIQLISGIVLGLGI